MSSNLSPNLLTLSGTKWYSPSRYILWKTCCHNGSGDIISKFVDKNKKQYYCYYFCFRTAKRFHEGNLTFVISNLKFIEFI